MMDLTSVIEASPGVRGGKPCFAGTRITVYDEALRHLLAGSPPKQLVLLTATPVNNSLWDLYHQLGYFLRNDAAFADVGIPSMRDHFARAMSINPDDLTPEHLFDVLDAVAVRRGGMLSGLD